jgi:hypothetical protein
MNRHATHPGRPRRFRPRAFAPGAIVALLLAVGAGSVRAAEHAPFPARAGLDIATAAAQVWAPDAYLVYVENDEGLAAEGAAPRWGYLFFSPALEKSRAYSVRDGRILVAENLDMKFEAPPLASGWIDSRAALEAAEQGAGRAFRREHQGEVATMLLMRGAFLDGDPDQTTWTVIYNAPGAPSLFVMVDAIEGKVRRTWRG